jgi:hypothetical protein
VEDTAWESGRLTGGIPVAFEVADLASLPATALLDEEDAGTNDAFLS